MITETERLARFKMSLVPQIGPLSFKRLIQKFDSAENFWDKYKKSPDLPVKLLHKIKSFDKSCDLDNEISLVYKKGLEFVAIGESNYPKYLSQTTDPPPILFYKGQIEHLSTTKIVAVVGSRKLTEYGKYCISNIVEGLCDANYTIVSGMALGVDRYAHMQAIAQSKPTIAVLATSPDNPSPRSNYDIYKKILENGCVVSESYKEQKFEKGLFPRRNRIIAGIAQGTLVVEADSKSGAIITADVALNENREVFAIPGNINQQMSKGTNKLIKEGRAKLVQDVGDILEELQANFKSQQIQDSIKYIAENEVEDKIIKLLSNGAKSIDEIKNSLDIDLGRILSNLSILEIKGVILKSQDGKFSSILL